MTKAPFEKRNSNPALDVHHIPRTLAEATVADRTLVTMRDAGEGWPAIRTMWKRLTGVEPGNSTLPSRYIRIKQHIIVSDEAEDEDLIRCEREIAEAYVLNRWTMIGDAMLLKGYKQYEADTPERRFNELNKACHDQNEKPDGEGAATHGTKCEDVEDDH